MNGQAKASIPALIGIITLLLAGIAGLSLMSGEQQAIQIAETRAITLEDKSHNELATVFRADADAAAVQTTIDIAADLAVELKHSPSNLIAMSEAATKQAQAR